MVPFGNGGDTRLALVLDTVPLPDGACGLSLSSHLLPPPPLFYSHSGLFITCCRVTIPPFGLDKSICLFNLSSIVRIQFFVSMRLKIWTIETFKKLPILKDSGFKVRV